ncbi:MAG: hypothetical protein K0V04_26050 [Deltaproteobacteria bacterium]|nr:hypothetical protein [Deltaproteobacteria bacterium]
MSRLPTLLLLTVACPALACTVGNGGGGSFGDGGPNGDGGSGTAGETEDTEGGGAGIPTAPDDGREFVEEAKKDFPTYLDLHEKVITRTCTPNANVCHNNMEYPDLRTPQSMLGVLGGPCNLDVEDPLNTYNACEPRGDVLRFTSGGNLGWETHVAYVDFPVDAMGVVSSAVVYLAEPIPAGMIDPMTPESLEFLRITDSGMLTVGEINDAVTYAAGVSAFQVVGYDMLGDSVHTLLEDGLRGGDPNRDGILGANEDEHFQEIKPGDPWGSYLLQRLQGNVPGSPMPLANQPLSASEVVAIACWIEGADAPDGDSPYAVIDYDGCSYAAEFGEPDPDSGATFTNDVLPILEARCATAGCHSSVVPAADLDLTADVARDSLFQMSVQNPDIPLVEPGNPTGSYLITKLTGDGFQGQRMPLGANPLSQEQEDIIRLWISYGAPDD